MLTTTRNILIKEICPLALETNRVVPGREIVGDENYVKSASSSTQKKGQGRGIVTREIEHKVMLVVHATHICVAPSLIIKEELIEGDK